MFLDFDAAGLGGLGIGPAGTIEISFYERGCACSRDSSAMDLIEAHKWFNLAAMMGDDRGAAARSDIAYDMTQREVAEAQRRARNFLRAN